MMKYVIVLFMIAMCLVGNVRGDWLAYSYKASIKRMNNVVSTVKYSSDVYDQANNASILLDTYTTATDTFTGYLLVEVCQDCSEANESSVAFGDSYLYLIRGADKSKAVWKFVSEVEATLFDKGVAMRPEDDVLAGNPTSLNKLNKVCMGLNFMFENMSLTAQSGSYVLPYGFLGFASSDGVISSVGFGKTRLITETNSTGLGLCDPITTTSCIVVSEVTDGKMVGNVTYQGCCGAPSLWEICTFAPTERAVVQGTWAIRLNEKVSKAVNAESDLAGVESVIVDKLGGKSMIAVAE